MGVPDLVARVLTYPERVTDFNFTKMQQYILNGPDRHPGANYVNHQTGDKRFACPPITPYLYLTSFPIIFISSSFSSSLTNKHVVTWVLGTVSKWQRS